MNENFMKEKPVFPLLVSMALPMVISMLVNSLYNIVDSFFVAQISEDAMTALSLVYPVQNFVNAVAIGFGIGLNAVISYYLGAGDKKAAGCAATQGLALTMLHAVILTIGSLLVIERFLPADVFFFRNCHRSWCPVFTDYLSVYHSNHGKPLL